MRTWFFEASNVDDDGGRPFNWGKFVVGRWEPDEWARLSMIEPGRPLIAAVGWGPEHVWVGDLQTGEAAWFRHGGLASYDLEKKQIWVCPLFEPFLTWVYRQPLDGFDAAPKHVKFRFADAPPAMAAPRHRGVGKHGPGGKQASVAAAVAGVKGPVEQAVLVWLRGQPRTAKQPFSGAFRAVDVARGAVKSQQVVGQVLRRLEDRELVVRAGDWERPVLWRLTATGAATADTLAAP